MKKRGRDITTRGVYGREGKGRTATPLRGFQSTDFLTRFLSSLSSNLNVITGDVMNEFIHVNYTRSHNDHQRRRRRLREGISWIVIAEEELKKGEWQENKVLKRG